MRISLLCCHVFALSSLTAAEEVTDCPAHDHSSHCVPPDCRWDGSSCENICFKYQTSWEQNEGGADMPGTSKTNPPTAADCQKKCNTTNGCRHFSFWPKQLNCHLQDENSEIKEDKRAVSGAPDCEEVCFEISYRWDPLNMGGEKRTNEDSALACQQRCQRTSGCKHFAWWFKDNGCHLQDVASTNRMLVKDPNARDVVSGPDFCESLTLAPTPAGSRTSDKDASANESNTSGENETANESNTSHGSADGSQESMPGSAEAAADVGSPKAYDDLLQNSALDAVRPPSMSAGRVSIGGVGVKVGVVTVALGGFVAVSRIRRDPTPTHMPLRMEEDLLIE